MTVLIINQHRESDARYIDWLHTLDEPIIVFTSPNKIKNHNRFSIFKEFDNFNTNFRVEMDAFNFGAESGITRIIALHEFDLLRAAKLRDVLNIPGQPFSTALAFRNKAIMKELVSQKNVAVPKFKRIEEISDILSFLATHNFPIVIKPLLGAGGESTYVVKTTAELEELLETYDFKSRPMEVEEYVPGDMYHVDGFVIEGQLRFAWASQYVHSNLSFKERQLAMSILLSPANPLNERLIAFAKTVLDALPKLHNLSFHLEAFHTPSDQFILCEVASRTGGGKIRSQIYHAFGIDLNELTVKAQVGLPIPSQLSKQPSRLTGSVLVPPIGKMFINSPSVDLPSKFLEYELHAHPGKEYNEVNSIVDVAASFVTQGNSEKSVQESLEQAASWFNNYSHWDG